MKQNDFNKQVSSKLNGLAQHHPHKSVVMQNVLDQIQDKKASRFGFLKMSGYAIAAAITGFVILPTLTEVNQPSTNQAVISPKLSPQMIEDLEMLLVMGEDKVPHGS